MFAFTKSLFILAAVFLVFGLLRGSDDSMALTRALAPVLVMLIVLAPIFFIADLLRSSAFRSWSKRKLLHFYPASSHQKPPQRRS